MFDFYQFYGIIAILLSAAGYFFAFKAFRKNNINLAITLIILSGLILRIYVSSDLFLHEWDERYHALVAKNLIRNPLKPVLYAEPLLPYDYRDWACNHIWVHKQPVPLWCMALSMYIFGTNEIALRIPSILLSALAIFFTYYIASYLFDRKVGLLAAFFHSINGLIVEITGGRTATDHTDIFFLCLVELSVFLITVYLKTRKRYINIFIGISMGLAIMTKWLPALIVLPLWFLLVIKKDGRRDIIINFFIIIITCLITFLPWQIYIYTSFPLEARWESGYNIKHITETLGGHEGSFLFHFLFARIIFGELVYIALCWYFYILAKNKTRPELFMPAVWFLIPYLFFSLVKTKMQGYILFAAPAIFIIMSYFWRELYSNLNKIKYRKACIVILIFLILLPLRYTLERTAPLEDKRDNLRWAEELKSLNNKIGPEKAVIFNVDRPVEAMFYTPYTVYSSTPTEEQIELIRRKGYKIYIYRDGNIKYI